VDGIKLVAAEEDGAIFTSLNSGMSWTSNSVPSGFWASVASSADGNKVVAATKPPGVMGAANGIYTSYSTPVPSLSITPSDSNVLLSWILPSTNFVLQQNFDLTTKNWMDVTNPPVRNLTNLQNQVTLPPSGNSSFYRLKTP
jgi:hypothetical protein